MTHQLVVNLPKNIEMEFPECQFDKEIETNFPFKRKALNKNIIGKQKNITETVQN